MIPRIERDLWIREEQLGSHFTKYHVHGPWPFDIVLHKFSHPDFGPPHDHPWSFRSIILKGGYIEETYSVERGRGRNQIRQVGESFVVLATHIHRITELLDGECWTMILPFIDEMPRAFGFYEFREDGVWCRPSDRMEFQRLEVRK